MRSRYRTTLRFVAVTLPSLILSYPVLLGEASLLLRFGSLGFLLFLAWETVDFFVGARRWERSGSRLDVPSLLRPNRSVELSAGDVPRLTELSVSSHLTISSRTGDQKALLPKNIFVATKDLRSWVVSIEAYLNTLRSDD